MTQLLSLITNNHIEHLSDRRSAWLFPDGSTAPKDDTTNKAVVWYNRAVFTYTGVADLMGEPTDTWLCTRVASKPLIADAIETVRVELTHLFTLTGLQGQQLAIVVPGWSEEAGRMSPVVAVVSNFLGPASPRVEQYPDGNSAAWLHMRVLPVQTTFRYDAYGIGAGITHTLCVAGQPLAHTFAEQHQRARALLGKVRREVRREDRPAYILKLLIDEMRRVATSNPAVGMDLMAVSVPKPSPHLPSQGFSLLSGPPNRDFPTCHYVPADATIPKAYLASLAAGTCMERGSVTW